MSIDFLGKSLDKYKLIYISRQQFLNLCRKRTLDERLLEIVDSPSKFSFK